MLPAGCNAEVKSYRHVLNFFFLKDVISLYLLQIQL